VSRGESHRPSPLPLHLVYGPPNPSWGYANRGSLIIRGPRDSVASRDPITAVLPAPHPPNNSHILGVPRPSAGCPAWSLPPPPQLQLADAPQKHEQDVRSQAARMVGKQPLAAVAPVWRETFRLTTCLLRLGILRREGVRRRRAPIR
jgi:hypothetical protein